MIVGILLDIDDTLVDNKSAIRHAIAHVAGKYLPAETDIDAAAAFFRDDRHGRYRAFTRGEIDHREQRRSRAADLHHHFGGPDFTEDQLTTWIGEFDGAYSDGWRAHDDARPLVDALVAAGIPFGAVSNARRSQQVAKLLAVGLTDVPLLVTFDDLGFGKPDPRIFLEGCRLLGTSPEQTMYVGDEYDLDAVAAVAAGLVGVWCDRPRTCAARTDAEVAADGVIRIGGLADLLRLIST